MAETDAIIYKWSHKTQSAIHLSQYQIKTEANTVFYKYIQRVGLTLLLLLLAAKQQLYYITKNHHYRTDNAAIRQNKVMGYHNIRL